MRKNNKIYQFIFKNSRLQSGKLMYPEVHSVHLVPLIFGLQMHKPFESHFVSMYPSPRQTHAKKRFHIFTSISRYFKTLLMPKLSQKIYIDP